MRKILFSCWAVLGLATVLSLGGCNAEKALEQILEAEREVSGRVTASVPSQADRRQVPSNPSDSVSIASFNIQVLGQSKMKKRDVVDVLVKVIRRFDVVAVQELRSKDQTIIPQFVELLNAEGRAYDFVVGPRLGRTSSKEQYVYLYDTQRVELTPGSVYTVDDKRDLLHREPLVANFRTRGPTPGKEFSFTLINIHTDPDETDTELDALDDVYRTVQQRNRNEDDVILLGDLNVDERHLGELGRLPDITWVIAGIPTNTRGTKSYDNIVFESGNTVEYTGRAGVFDLAQEFGLTDDEALDVSDHLPVWALFHSTEGTSGRLAAGGEAATR
jgi:endonuclease/exonuclease/phosphatase family metal-dependent hydrolase